MYTLYFYFDRKFLQKIFDFLIQINKEFCEIFEIPFDWKDVQSNDELLARVDEDGLIWDIWNIVDGPNNEVKIWDDRIEISLEINSSLFEKINLDSENSLLKFHDFCEKIFKKIPANSVTFWDWDSTFIDKVDNDKYFVKNSWFWIFWYFRENGEIVYKDGWDKYSVSIFGKNRKPQIEKRNLKEIFEEFFGK